MEHYILTSVVFFAAGCVTGMVGFGAVLFSIPLLAMFLDIKQVIPVTSLAALATHVIILFQLWNCLEFKKIRPLIVGALPGILVGVMMLKYAAKEVIQILLGLTLIAYTSYALSARKKPKNTFVRWSYLFGLLSGFLGGAIGASGPPIIVYTSLQDWSKDTIKVTIQGYFILSGLLLIGGQALTGLITAEVFKLFFAALPAVACGTFVGSIFYAKAREEDYRKVILIVLAFLGLFTLYRGLS